MTVLSEAGLADLAASGFAYEVTAEDLAATWDGRDAVGRRVAGGLYLCALRVGGDTRTRTLVVAR